MSVFQRNLLIFREIYWFSEKYTGFYGFREIGCFEFYRVIEGLEPGLVSPSV
jgi:hypothetical protein